MDPTAPSGTSVSLAAFNAALADACTHVADPNEGLFGPRSLAWRVYGESAIVWLAGPTMLVLQTTHPYVAHAIERHSNYRADPLGRAVRTVDALFSWVFGDLEHVLETARDIRRRHNKVGGTIANDVGPYAAGHRYSAADSNAMLWVHATLWYVPVQVYELLHGPLPDEEKERYYQQTRVFTQLFGIPDAIVPATWPAFCEYFARMVASNICTVDKIATRAPKLMFSPAHPWLKLPVEQSRLLMVGLLPEPIRAAHGWTFGDAEQRAFDRAIQVIRTVNRLLPPLIRYVPAYRHAVMRTRATPPSLATRLYFQAEAEALRELAFVAGPRTARRPSRPAPRVLFGMRVPRVSSLARAASEEVLSSAYRSMTRLLAPPRARSAPRPDAGAVS